MAKIAVAPLVGAWIEMMNSRALCSRRLVAPLVGAWIEINNCHVQRVAYASLPSWERGLKYIIPQERR